MFNSVEHQLKEKRLGRWYPRAVKGSGSHPAIQFPLMKGRMLPPHPTNTHTHPPAFPAIKNKQVPPKLGHRQTKLRERLEQEDQLPSSPDGARRISGGAVISSSRPHTPPPPPVLLIINRPCPASYLVTSFLIS